MSSQDNKNLETSEDNLEKLKEEEKLEILRERIRQRINEARKNTPKYTLKIIPGATLISYKK